MREGVFGWDWSVRKEGVRVFTFSSFDRVVERISKISAQVAAFLLVPWVTVFVAYIILRDFFSTTLIFVEEYTEHLLVLITFLALAYTLRRGGHVRLDFAVKLLPERVGNIVNVAAVIIGLVISCFFVQFGFTQLLYSIREGTRYPAGTEAFLWPIQLWIPVGYSLLILELLVCLYHSLMAVWKDFSETVKTRELKQ